MWPRLLCRAVVKPGSDLVAEHPAASRVFAVALLALTLMALVFAWSERRHARQDRRLVAQFIYSDSLLNQQRAQNAKALTLYWRGLAVHGSTCAASCVATKFSAFLDSIAAAREQSATRDSRAADAWLEIARRLGADVTVTAPR